MTDRNAGFHSQQHRDRIGRQARKAEAVDFFNMLTGPELLQATEAHLPEHRERLFPPTETLSMFMMQALNEDGSCQKAVNGWAARRAAEGLSTRSIRTGAYCRARQRLPIEMVEALARETGRLLNLGCPSVWRGRVVKLVDGSGISMPDTPENQARFPQPSTQAKGVGFPLARIVTITCLASGALIDAAMGPFEGKGNSELGLFRQLSTAFAPGDVMLADAFYCNYFLIATLILAGVDVVLEQNGARITDFRRGRRLAARDHIVNWPKPKVRPDWMSVEQYHAFADEITLREVKVDGQVIVTTMLDHRAVRKGELSKLYGRRWNIELDLRDLKTTLGMETLHCKTPQMNEKELWVHLLAYNLIRLLMAQAALNAGVQPRQISFKHTVQLWTEWTARPLEKCSTESHFALFRLIAQLRVGNRPDRIEPRMRKRRPKPYPWLKVPRDQARSHIRLHGHAPRA